MLTTADLIKKLQDKFGSEILEVTELFGQLSVSVRQEPALSLLDFLRHNPEMDYDFLMDLFGIDFLTMGGPERFAVVYNLYSMRRQHRLRIKVFAPENNPRLASVQHLWPSANWAERETFDMYGLIFENHPDLRRILCPDDFTGHPLRKDFPLQGIGYRENYEKITRETAQ